LTTVSRQTRVSPRVEQRRDAADRWRAAPAEGRSGELAWVQEIEVRVSIQRPLQDVDAYASILGLLEPPVARILRRHYQANLDRLRTILEAQPATAS
jgi:hypothetical protein